MCGENITEAIGMIKKGIKGRPAGYRRKKSVPHGDTHPGPGVDHLNGKTVDTGAGELLGEDD